MNQLSYETLIIFEMVPKGTSMHINRNIIFGWYYWWMIPGVVGGRLLYMLIHKLLLVNVYDKIHKYSIVTKAYSQNTHRWRLHQRLTRDLKWVLNRKYKRILNVARGLQNIISMVDLGLTLFHSEHWTSIKVEETSILPLYSRIDLYKFLYPFQHISLTVNV